MEDIYTMGVDIGAAAAKCVILKNGKEISGHAVIPAGIGTSGPEKSMEAAINHAGISSDSLACMAATGYGRNLVADAKFTLSELSCHVLGVHASFSEAKTVIDIGGQDVKVLHIGTDGQLGAFLMNDKCAAGTGRFLEVMARILELDIHTLEETGRGAAAPIRISSTCTVFAESEVISQLAANADIRDLVAGLHASVAVKAASLARRLGVLPPVVMTGGVALNGGVVAALEKELHLPIFVSPIAQLNGAYGAAIWAWRKFIGDRKGGGADVSIN